MKQQLLASTLADIRSSINNISTLLANTSPRDIDGIFVSNPVFFDGLERDPSERPETYETDRYIHYVDQLSKAQSALLQAQERLMRLGTHHISLPRVVGRQDEKEEGSIRQQPRKTVSPALEEDDEGPLDSSASVSPY